MSPSGFPIHVCLCNHALERCAEPVSQRLKPKLLHLNRGIDGRINVVAEIFRVAFMGGGGVLVCFEAPGGSRDFVNRSCISSGAIKCARVVIVTPVSVVLCTTALERCRAGCKSVELWHLSGNYIAVNW